MNGITFARSAQTPVMVKTAARIAFKGQNDVPPSPPADTNNQPPAPPPAKNYGKALMKGVVVGGGSSLVASALVLAGASLLGFAIAPIAPIVGGVAGSLAGIDIARNLYKEYKKG